MYEHQEDCDTSDNHGVDGFSSKETPADPINQSNDDDDARGKKTHERTQSLHTGLEGARRESESHGGSDNSRPTGKVSLENWTNLQEK